MSAIVPFKARCRDTGELDVGALTVTIRSLEGAVLRMNALSASGAAAAAISAFLGFSLRAVIDSRSRSWTLSAVSFAFEIVPGARPVLRLPTSHAHEVALAALAVSAGAELGVPGLRADDALSRMHVATSVLMSPASAPDRIILA
jgi:hypothetical protein